MQERRRAWGGRGWSQLLATHQPFHLGVGTLGRLKQGNGPPDSGWEHHLNGAMAAPKLRHGAHPSPPHLPTPALAYSRMITHDRPPQFRDPRVEQQPPQGVLVCDHAGLVINRPLIDRPPQVLLFFFITLEPRVE